MANATTPVIQINEGNVGIGTTTPGAKLDIQGTQGQLFSVTDDLSGSIFAVADISGVPILDVNSDGTSYFDGNVGIGVTAPDTKLVIQDVTKSLIGNVAGTAQGTLSLVSSDALAVDIGASMVFGGNYITGSSTKIAYAAITGRKELANSVNADGYLAFYTWLSTGMTEKMRISSGGAIKFNNYGAGTLVTDASGNITASTSGPGTGTVTGSGTDNTIPLWNGTTGLDNSAITQTAVGAISINETNPANATEFNIKAIQSYCSMRMKGATGSGADISFYDNLTFLAGIAGIPDESLQFTTSTNTASDGLALSLNSIQEARFYGSGIDGTMENPISFTTSDSGIGQENRIRSSVSQTRANNILKFETATNTSGTFNENQLVLNGDAKVGINTDTMSGTFNIEVPLGSSGIGSDFRIKTGGSGYGMRNLSVEIPGYGTGIRIYSPTNSYIDNAALGFYQQTAQVGGIIINTSSVSYNTTSDYRLKENRENISGAIERVKELKPTRFNWIKEPGESKVDGFYAHELAEVIPEAVTGEKDALDWEGNPNYQSIDQAKIVPLLTAALQQAISKIEKLETRIQILENK